tara:strand:+ start:160318 stop:161379 length:1062 start_codon:yes stop_codon:yes gene_type:complete
MNRYWSELVGRLTPYVPGEQPRHEKLVKLNTNESPYPPSPRVMEAIAAVSADSLRLYPDPESTILKEAFAALNNLQPEQVFIGNGSDEVLAHVFQGLLKHERPLCFPDITYSFYPVWCDLYGIDYRQLPVADDFSVDVSAYAGDAGGIIIPNPNAPTGMPLPKAQIRELLQNNPESVVVIDEAYIDFGGESAVGLIDEFPNLMVVQTLSKSRALAGLRVGVAMGSSKLIEALERIKNSFNSYPLDVIAQRAAQASLQDDEYFRETCARIAGSRKRLARNLEQLGFDVRPSVANFLFVHHPRHAARALFARLREQGIIVRYFDKPRISEYLRITVGTDDQCDALLDALSQMLSE